MKRDEVREGLGQAVDYARSHGRQLALALGAVALVATAVGGGLAYRSHRAAQANDELARAIRLYEAQIDAVAPQPDDPDEPRFADEASRAAAARVAFERVRELYHGSRVAAVAAAFLGDLAARDGDLERARELWAEAGDARSSALTVQMVLNRLALDRAAGRGEEVLGELRAMLDGGGGRLPQVVVLDQLATTLERLGRDAEAAEIYQRIVDEHPQSAYSQRARERVSAL